MYKLKFENKTCSEYEKHYKMEPFLSLVITFIIAHWKQMKPVMCTYLVLGLLAGFHYTVCKASLFHVMALFSFV